MQTYSVEEARARLGDIVLAASLGTPALITYRGVPAALVSAVTPPVIRSEDSGRATEAHRR